MRDIQSHPSSHETCVCLLCAAGTAEWAALAYTRAVARLVRWRIEMRVYCATFYSETNTFSPLVTGREDFVPMALAQRGTASFATAFAPVHELGGEVVGSFNRAALPGGMVTRAAYESLRGELLEDLASQIPVDLITLNLHGAMVADGYADCEGDVLAKIRTLAGASTPIVAS